MNRTRRQALWMLCCAFVAGIGIYTLANSAAEEEASTDETTSMISAKSIDDEISAGNPGGSTQKDREVTVAPSPPSLADTQLRAVYVRGPQRSWENDIEYANRAQFVEGYEAFLSATSLSPEQKHDLLLALYDYQETRQALLEELDVATGESIRTGAGGVHDSFFELFADAGQQLADRLDEIFSLRQLRAWYLYCGPCWVPLGGEWRILHLQK